MNTNLKIKIQKLKISKSSYSQTQQYHQILKPKSNKSIHKYNTTNPNKKNLKLKISISSLSCLPFSIFSLSQTLLFQIKHHSLSDSVDRQWLFFFQSLKQVVVGLLIGGFFFFFLFLRWVWWLGCWIGVGLNWLWVIELAWVWIIYGLLNQCGLLKGCGFELVWAIESVWVWIGCGLLNRCGFESSMGCWISVGCWKGVGLNWSGLLNRYRLVVLVLLGCVRWLRLLWIDVGWLFWFWNFQ